MKSYLKIATIVGSLALVTANGFDEAKPGLRAHSKPAVQQHSRSKPRVKPRASPSVEKAGALRENPKQEKPKAVRNHYSDVKQQGNPRSTCTTGDGWTDNLGYVCTWYEDNEPAGCPTWGYFAGANGLTADQACCHCQNVESMCFTGNGWTDGSGATCSWYEINEDLGCPTWGTYPGENGLTAGQACCHCQNVETLAPVSIQNLGSEACLFTQYAPGSEQGVVFPNGICDGTASTQWNRVGNLIQSTEVPSQCLFPVVNHSPISAVILRECSYSSVSGEFFFEDDNTIRHSDGRCLTTGNLFAELVDCAQGNASQQWQVIA